jgi:hypothetical protein
MQAKTFSNKDEDEGRKRQSTGALQDAGAKIERASVFQNLFQNVMSPTKPET